MTVEIPEFKRGCFCLPLRPVLLAWGYFKILASVLISILAYFKLRPLNIILFLIESGNDNHVIWIKIFTAIILYITLILFITDFVATIVFIVGSHKKNVNLLRVFYIFCVGELIVTILWMVVAVGISTSDTTQFLVIYEAYLVTLAVQAFFSILLLRSEVIKLESSGELRIVNSSAEAQCIMTSKHNPQMHEWCCTHGPSCHIAERFTHPAHRCGYFP